LCSRRWVTEQYDRYVLGNTVLATPDDAGVVRLEGAAGRGIALALDGPARFCALDPYAGAQLALAEAYRNVAATGATPYAVTDCLNFGSPEEPEVMWAFAETCRGLADGCRALELPVTGGNVSFYNATGGTAILPTPVVGVMGVFDDVERRTPSGFQAEGDAVYLLGETADEFDGSAWSWIVHRHLGGTPPAVDLQREVALAAVLVAGSREGLLTAAHDVSDGGLTMTLAELSLRFGYGVHITLPESIAGGDPFVALFSESAGRAVVAVPAAGEERFTELCAAGELPCRRIGTVTGRGEGASFDVDGVFTLSLARLREAHEGTLPALLGELAPSATDAA
jgi:phosphoribosylformylglycinamidine synthase